LKISPARCCPGSRRTSIAQGFIRPSGRLLHETEKEGIGAARVREPVSLGWLWEATALPPVNPIGESTAQVVSTLWCLAGYPRWLTARAPSMTVERWCREWATIPQEDLRTASAVFETALYANSKHPGKVVSPEGHDPPSPCGPLILSECCIPASKHGDVAHRGAAPRSEVRETSDLADGRMGHKLVRPAGHDPARYLVFRREV
jgi:hypothetical protein